MQTFGLPFNSASNQIKIIQGNNGPWSHKILKNGQDSRYAVDFELQIGAEIKAAREGTVMGIIDSSDTYYDGNDPVIGLGLPFGSTNFVAIRHDDGTVAYYMHLAKNVPIKEGDLVSKGQILGVTGLSGWIGDKPHLHFQVNNADGVSLPITFEGYQGPLEHDAIYHQNLRIEGR
jgi:murein DD-endopeptidase MepM/ murein hydrolase activator NlpD